MMPRYVAISWRPQALWLTARAASGSSRRCASSLRWRLHMPHRIVVTGGAGVIGRELIGRLVAGGAEVMSLDREPMPDRLASSTRHVQVDLSEGGMEEISGFQPETIYHLAAAFERSEEESGFWLPGYRDNIAVSHRLHDTIRKMPGLKTYVFASRDVVSRWVRALIAGRPVEVFNPENRFDYIFAGDVAEGLRRLADSPTASGIVNLATGRSPSIAEVAATVLRATGAAPALVRHRGSNAPYEASGGCIDRLLALTNWRPPTAIDAGVARLVAHEQAI